jgi:para-nitrobenzyl esterase
MPFRPILLLMLISTACASSDVRSDASDTASDTAPVALAAPCVARTTLGTIVGSQAAGACRFFGIPYAAPPTGTRRFLPPQPVTAWSRALVANDRSRVCPQPRSFPEEYPDNRARFSDEDCLYLNVWTPAVDRAARPVMVFIHGGAGRIGTANEGMYDGAGLSTRGDVVVVTLNYRLGVLGWTELGGLDPRFAGSGNNGLRDQLAALVWVHDHIRDLGGDPANVTVFGQSVGAASISAILATDRPGRWVRHAILESGSGYMVHPRSLADQLAGLFLGVAGITSMADLQAMSTEQLLDAQGAMLGASPGLLPAVMFAPYIDGELVRGSAIERLAAGNARDVDLLLGTTRDEVRFFGLVDPPIFGITQADYTPLFPAPLAAQRDAIFAAYAAASHPGTSDSDTILAMLTDQGVRVPITRMAEAQSRWRPTYVYELTWSADPFYGAIHSSDLPFVFGTLHVDWIPGGSAALAADRPGLVGLAHAMMDAWTAFARCADPHWPAYRAPSRLTMTFDLERHVVAHPRDELRARWNGFDFAALNLELAPPGP